MACNSLSRSTCIALIAAGFIPTLTAQTPKPTFEVASVKRSPPPDGSGPVGIRPGLLTGDHWSAQNATLLMMIRSAFSPQYQLPGQIVGGPSWLDSERFDVNAKVEGTLEQARVQLMAQALLVIDRVELPTSD
jgi:uncharacterized protein (TIGR03435 family)